jgi:HEAT repeat protein
VKALNDEDSSVRTLAARSLGRHGAREHEATVLAHVESRDFDTRPTEEVEALLGAFARVGGERAVAVLDKLWRRRRFSAHPLPVRLAALQALGAVSSPAAERALKEAMESGEAQLQRTAVRALHEAQALRTRPRA